MTIYLDAIFLFRILNEVDEMDILLEIEYLAEKYPKRKECALAHLSTLSNALSHLKKLSL